VNARLELDEQTLEELAERVAELLAERRPNGPEPWIGVEEAAEHLACPRSRIYSLVHRRDSTRIPHRKDGSRLLFKRSELDAWLHDSQEESA
jgi:excisionase family DNA binding protein